MIDAAHLAELDLVLGRETTDALIAPMLVELASAPEKIRAHIANGDIVAARASAHGLRGAALGLGCVGVAELCARIETETADRLPTLVEELAPIAAETADILRRRTVGGLPRNTPPDGEGYRIRSF